MSSENAITVDNVSKVYHIYKRPQDRVKQLLFRRQYFTPFRALQDVSFNVAKGEVIGIIGRNGSGKSTLLQIIANTLAPTSGSAHVMGRVAALLELGSGFNTEFTGRENVYINGAILGLTKKRLDECFPGIEAFADIGEFIDRPVRVYSSGMMVRLAFAVSVNVDADVLIIDEALAVGDVAFQFKCLHRLKELIERGTSILLVSHDLQLVKGYCTRAVYLKRGRLAYQGDCETATELFLMDMRADQSPASQSTAVQTKPSLNSETGMAFGTNSGRILSVEIGCGEISKQHFRSGERIWVKITAQVSENVCNPRLVMVVRDQRGYNLFAYDNVFAGIPLIPDNNGFLQGVFKFTCLLSEGEYSLTLRLDDFQSEALNIILDKQINAYNFKILTEQKRFYGVVDLSGEFIAMKKI